MSIVLVTGEPASHTARALWDTLGTPLGRPATYVIDTGASSIPGMAVTEDEISGSPTTAGTFTVAITAYYEDANGDEASWRQSVEITVEASDIPVEPEEPEEPEPGTEIARIARFLGQADDPELLALISEHLPVITAMAKAYTRGGGFTDAGPADDVAAVITAATCRLVANPEQLRYQAGSIQINDSFRGWTLAESFVLNRYRRRAR